LPAQAIQRFRHTGTAIDATLREVLPWHLKVVQKIDAPFGSVAAANTHQESDLDLAVVPRESSVREQKLDMLADLAGRGFDNVDLIFLDTDDIVLKFEAVRRNRLVYEAGDFDRGSYFSLIIRQYFDFLPYLRVQRAAYKRRILDDDG